ncbi:MAG: hypothetical protein HKN23_10940 [Verrucomicrobiales bacterium]|nr:hypothetical protein [Verrucomicrobiales bacterium]
MPLFSGITDEIANRLDDQWDETFSIVGKLTDVLDGLDSYAEMKGGEAEAELLKLDAELTERLRHPVASPDESLTPLAEGIRFEIAACYALEALYRDTVGHPEECQTSVELKTFPIFPVRDLPKATRDAALEKLLHQLDLDSGARDRIDQIVNNSRSRLDRRRSVVDWLRNLIDLENPDRSSVKSLFDRFFPWNPLSADDVDFFVSRTCFHWFLPSAKDFPTDSPQADFLKSIGRFRFRFFSHFPTFSSFECRDSDPQLLDELESDLGLTHSEAVRWLNSSVTIEPRGEIEKYLIHDTWGHMWQGDLTELGILYDRMESLIAPMEAAEHLEVDGRICSIFDLFHVSRAGGVKFDHDLAAGYVLEWTRIRFESLLAPIIAELTADMVEYQFHLRVPDRSHEFPSSSTFGTRPTKLDFAWVDLGYFVRRLGKSAQRYQADARLRKNLTDRLCLLIRRKYGKRAADSEAIRAGVDRELDQFLARADETFERCFSVDFSDRVHSSFARMFTNLLRLQYTLNQLIDEELRRNAPKTLDGMNVLLLFLARWFLRDPLRNFWDMDETVSKIGGPMLGLVHRAEKNE